MKKIKPDGSKTLYVGGIYEVDKTSGGTDASGNIVGEDRFSRSTPLGGYPFGETRLQPLVRVWEMI